MHHVYILTNKTQSIVLQTIQDFTAWIYNQYNLKILVSQLEGETSLGHKWNAWIATLGISEKRSAPHTQAPFASY